MAYPPFALPVSIRTIFFRRVAVIALVTSPLAIPAQAPAAQPNPQQPAATQSQPPASATPQATAEPQAVSNATMAPAGSALPISEEVLQRRLVGKQFFLRGGWLGDSLNFSEHGTPIGHPQTGSFTLSVIQINKIDLKKHHIEIEGSRYALHFLGNLPYENSANEVERINITPKKKTVRISVEREQLIKSKKDKKDKHAKSAPAPATAAQPSPETTEPAPTEPAPAAQPAAQPAQAASTETASTEEEPAKDALPLSSDVTYTTSPAHAAQVLNEALDRIFAPALDDKMRDQMPEFWQLYYKSQSAGTRFDPHDGSVFHASAVDQPAKLMTSIAPQSNEFAQANGIVGQALYRLVVSADGTPQQIAAERPIGFGLDENAVAAIRKATFHPAMKNGQPVAELLDLSVVFRIYSNRTSAASSAQSPDGANASGSTPAVAKPALPGPYSVQHPPAQQDTAPKQDAPPANPPSVTPETNTPQANPPANPQPAPQTSPQSF